MTSRRLRRLQGPPATMIEPLPIREGRKKRRRNSDRSRGGAGAEDQREATVQLNMEDFLQADAPLEEAEGMEEVFASLNSMKMEVELMRKPLGTFESPARTCKELMMCHPHYRDGTGRSLQAGWNPIHTCSYIIYT